MQIDANYTSSIMNRSFTAAIISPPCLWGKHKPSRAMLSARAVHPHACGENTLLRAGWWMGNGSPPRLWENIVKRFARFCQRQFNFPVNERLTDALWSAPLDD
jgi:hypothetical protein